MSKNHSFFTVSTFAKIGIKRYFRDRVAIFFTVVFPLIFLFVFGGIFGKDSNPSFHIALINQSQTAVAQKFVDQLGKQNAFKIDPKITNLDQAKDKMSRSEIDAAVVLPPGFGSENAQQQPSGSVVIYYDQNDAEAAQTLNSILQSNLQGINGAIVSTAMPFKVKTSVINQNGLTRFDYTFAGLIGFSIMGLGIFGPVNYFPQMKKQGILRRLHITPLKVWEYFLSSVITNSTVGLFSIAVMFVVALTVFNFHMVGNYLALAIFIIFSIMMIFGIGLAIGGWAKNENQAAPLANIISFPMLFLSGTFFPRFLMPIWLQHVTSLLPLTPVIDGIRMIATEGKGLLEIGPQIGLIAIWMVIIYAVAFRVFRWE